MYEFTMGGAWFRWSALDHTSKRLAAGSLIGTIFPTIPIAAYLGDLGHAVGYRLGSGGASPRIAPSSYGILDTFPWMAWVALAGGLVAALCWWRFSVRQDEMFNRVQNWTLGMAGAWTMAATYIWIGLWAADVAPAPNAIAIAVGFYLALCVFWFAAVRRWA